MEESRRSCLQAAQCPPSAHPGLWLEKYLSHQLERKEPVQTGEETPQALLVKEAARIEEPSAYQLFFEVWKRHLLAAGAELRRAVVSGRLAVGLGFESVLETSVTLQRTYGTPYLPGSALKGLAARYARLRLEDESWGEGAEAYMILFGNTDQAGFVTFFDALYEPSSGHGGQALHPDVTTVHHPDYYRGEDKPPADWDNPTPVPFLSATGAYLLALSGPSEWVAAAFQILSLALREEGVGAKTSSGYGRLKVEGSAAEGPTWAGGRPADPEQLIVDEFSKRIQGIAIPKVAGQIHSVYQDWKALAISPKCKREIARAIVAKVEEASRSKKAQKKKWYQELLACLSER